MARITLPFFISMILFAEVGFAEGLAECPERPSDEVEARELAGSLFADGEASFQEKHFDAALAKFVCSLRMAEHENTVF
ncbi:MAG: hypothetical protein GY859_31520, partial [Desulfobacterales bacterium]|nr:hypothetical protein [Desulfobacterales bacterium]